MAQRFSVKSLFASAGVAAMVGVGIVGCQGPTVTTPEPPIATSQPVVPLVSTNPKANAAAQAAAQQSKAIDELLAARTQADAQDRGLTIVEPSKTNAPPKPTPTVPTPPPTPTPAPQADASAFPAPTIPKIDPAAVAPPAPTPTPAPVVDNSRPLPSIESLNAPANTAVFTQAPSPTPQQQPTNAQQTSNQAPIALPAPKPATVDSLEQQLAQRANEYPRDVAAQLDNQLLAFLKDQPAPDAAALGQLPSEDREIITAVVDGLSNFRNGVRNDNNMLMNRKIRPLVEMADRLKTRADLSITNAQLCTAVRGFGSYTPFEPAKLIYGEPRKLAVYCEVQNFASQFNDKSLWTTKLQLDLVLYAGGGMDMWHQKGLAVNDECRNRRHDFFIATGVTLPGGLAIDQYSLKITVSDLNANRVAETTIPLGVVAAEK